MAKITKNRSDAEMFENWQEKTTFENCVVDDDIKVSAKPAKEEAAQSQSAAFFAPELQEKVGKALLELKVKLYKEGIVDYDIKVTREGNQVVLTAVPTKKISKER